MGDTFYLLWGVMGDTFYLPVWLAGYYPLTGMASADCLLCRVDNSASHQFRHDPLNGAAA
jgi:hypothetical protein